MKIKIAKFLIFAITCSAFVITIISVIVGWNLTHPTKKKIIGNPSDFGLNYKSIVFRSLDKKIKLRGWVITPKKSKMTIIFSHGYKGNRTNNNYFLQLAKTLTEHGYRVILFDYRNSGESDGNTTTIGVKEKYDLLGAIQYAKKTYKDPIVLYGTSMGASTSILAAGKDKDVLGVIADSPFSDLESYLNSQLNVWTNLPKYPFTPMIMKIMPLITGIHSKDSSPIDELEHIYPRKILFIHGKHDPTIPYTESVKMYQLHPDKFTIWLTENTGHIQSYSIYKKEYENRILNFLESL